MGLRASPGIVLVFSLAAACGESGPDRLDAAARPDAAVGFDAGPPDGGPRPDGGLAADAAADGGLAADAAVDGGLAADADVDAGLAEDATADAGTAEDAAVDAGFAEDAAADAGSPVDAGNPVDAGVPVDAGSPVDAGAADAGCPIPPLAVDGPFPPGPPPDSAHLLLVDTTSAAVFRLALDGRVLEQWPSPVTRPAGVAHDVRSGRGFWVIGRPVSGPQLFRVDWSGTVSATITAGAFPVGSFEGLDHVLGSTTSLDVLATIWTNRNSVEVSGGLSPVDGRRLFEGLLTRADPWFGTHAERWACDDPGRGAYVFWSVRGGSALELRQWSPVVSLRTHALPTTGARGLTRSSRGHFYVVDARNRRVLHLAPDGSLVDSFPTPGRDPADLSYGE